MSDFDPIDVAMLGCGFAQGAGKKATAFSIDHAETMVDVARAMHVAYLAIQDEWSSVWAYEVAEPVGVRIGAHFLEHDCMPTTEKIAEMIQHAIAHAG